MDRLRRRNGKLNDDFEVRKVNGTIGTRWDNWDICPNGQGEADWDKWDTHL